METVHSMKFRFESTLLTKYYLDNYNSVKLLFGPKYSHLS